MMCYKDRTYCQGYKLCKTWEQEGCDRALTKNVIKEAEKAQLPLCVVEWFKECFVEGEKNG